MDFKDLIKSLGERVVKLKDNVLTEEATKNAFIMPFIKELGYDVFNPFDVVPEFTADLGIKQGERIDYALMKDSEPIILIECKWHGSPLNFQNSSQLFRYFHSTKAKFSILTNGIEYRFYTDLVETNKMDEKPFFVFDVTDMKDNQIEELKKFHKAYFDTEKIVNTASELKYMGELKTLIKEETTNPSPDFVKHFAKQVYSGVVTQKILDLFTDLVKKTFAQYFNDTITETLKTALTKEDNKDQKTATDMAAITGEPDNKIITTKEEIEGFLIVKSILRKSIPIEKIAYRDAQSYFAILFDDNNRKTICRLILDGNKKFVITFDDSKKEIKNEIKSLDDIYNLSDVLIETALRYEVTSNKEVK